MTRETIADDPDLAMSMYTGVRDNLIMHDAQEWDLDKINAYCEECSRMS